MNDTFLHILEGLQIQNVVGWRKFLLEKAEYIVKGSVVRRGDINIPAVICNAQFADDSQEMADMRAFAQDYIDNVDALEQEREDKLQPASQWKLESLIENGVDLNDAIQRKVWQKRTDLLTDQEKDNLIDEWEASQ